MLLAMEQRQNEDQRTLGKLFFLLVDEMADITFNRSLGILMAALMASLQEILKLSDEQLTAFTADFEARLPAKCTPPRDCNGINYYFVS